MNFFKLYDKLITKSHLPKVTSLENELKKIGLIRIILGLIVLVRFIEIAYTYTVVGTDPKLTLLSYAAVLLIALFTLGIFTPIVTVIMFFTIVRFDLYLNTFTLATCILVIALIPLVLANAGQYYSIDRLLAKNKFAKKLVRLPYLLVGAKNTNDIDRAYFLSFILYFIVSLGALYYHIEDTYWMNGLTTKSLLLNSYLSNHYGLFRILESNFSLLLSILSISAAIFQSIFQFLAIPLIFTKIGRYFVFIWGLIFFLISFFFLNLSYLPHMEIMLWVIIFLPINAKANKVEIFYDDYCNLCKKAMLFFKFINYNGRLKFIPISKNTETLKPYNLSEKEIKSYMSGLHKDKLYIGYDLYIQIAKVNPLLWWLLPILLLGKLVKLGPMIYNYIAENRFKLFEQCELSFEDEIAKEQPVIETRKFNLFQHGFYALYGITLIFFFWYKFPITEKHLPKPQKHAKMIYRSLLCMGLDIPNVFNKIDLSIGNMWMVVYSEQENGELKLLPIIGEEGQRLNYQNIDLFRFGNNNSDLLYYGTTLKFRRLIIDKDIHEEMEEGKLGFESLQKRVSFDYKVSGYDSEQVYLVRVYSSSGSKVSHSQTDPSAFTKVLEFENRYTFNGENLEAINQ